MTLTLQAEKARCVRMLRHVIDTLECWQRDWPKVDPGCYTDAAHKKLIKLLSELEDQAIETGEMTG